MPFQSASLWVGFILGLSPLGGQDGPWQYQPYILQLTNPAVWVSLSWGSHRIPRLMLLGPEGITCASLNQFI